MVPTRRRLLQVGGAAMLPALAGCTTTDLFESNEPTTEYTLSIDTFEVEPVEHALYEPRDDSVFGAPARTALEVIVPDGRHTTYGYRPLPEDAYVKHDDAYYQTKYIFTGRPKQSRQIVRVDSVPKEDVPEDAVLIDTLAQPSARVLKILHTHTQSNGKASTAEVLRGDGYVLRRPAERESRLATGNLDGRVVTMTDSGNWAYRVFVTEEELREPAHTALAIKVAASRSQFRSVVFGARIDAELTPAALSSDAQELLEQAIARGTYTESAPISESLDAVLDALGLKAVDSAATGKQLWYDEQFYRYGLYIDDNP